MRFRTLGANVLCVLSAGQLFDLGAGPDGNTPKANHRTEVNNQKVVVELSMLVHSVSYISFRTRPILIASLV